MTTEQMHLIVAFLLVSALHCGVLEAAMQLAVEPSGRVKVGTTISITCSTGNDNAYQIEVFLGGTRCNTGCKAPSKSKCKVINDGCSVSEDNRTLTVRFVAEENMNDKALQCAVRYDKSSIKLNIIMPPSIRNIAVESRAVVGTDVTLFCQVRSIAETIVKWLHGEQVVYTSTVISSTNRIMSNATYTIRQVSQANAGYYYCSVLLAAEPQEETKSAGMLVIIVEPPTSANLMCEPVNTEVLTDVDRKPIYSSEDTISCTCEATGAPDSTISMTFFKKVPDGDTKQRVGNCDGRACSHNYTVSSDDYSASLSCVAENEATKFRKSPVVSNEYHFSIRRRPENILPQIRIIDSDTLDMEEQSSHVLECWTFGEATPAINVQLLQGDNVFSPGNCSYTSYVAGKETKCTWYLSSLDTLREFNNRYFCRGTYHESTADSARVQIRFAPRTMTMSPEEDSKVYKEHEGVALTCTTDAANPQRNITWTFNNAVITADSISVTTRRGDYDGIVTVSTINPSTVRNQDGQYSCSIDDLDMRDSIDITINYPPEVSVDFDNLSPAVGEPVTVTCKATGGKPDVESHTNVLYKWDKSKDGQDQWTEVTANGEILTIATVSVADSAFYRCTVIIEESGQQAASNQLIVRHKPILSSLQPDRLVLSSAKCADLLEGEERLCGQYAPPIVSTPPEYTCQWLRNGEALDVAAFDGEIDMKDYEPCSLTFMARNDNLLGSYDLNATNEIGSSIFTVRVQLPSPPDKPIEFKVKKKSQKSCIVEWKSGFSGGSSQIFLVNATRISSPSGRRQTPKESANIELPAIEDAGLGEIMTAKLRPLDPDSEYKISIRAVNTNSGQNESDIDTITCKTPQVPKISASLEKSGSTAGLVNIKIKVLNGFRMVLHFCNKSNTVACTDIPINGQNPIDLRVPLQYEELVKQFAFELQFYDEDDLIKSIPLLTSGAAVSSAKSRQSGMQTEVLIGIAVGGIFVAILFITCTIFMLRRKHNPHESSSRGARRSSSDEDQNQANKPLMKDNGTAQPNSPRSWTEPSRRAPPSGGNFQKTTDSQSNNNNSRNNNNNHSTRNAKTNRSNDCEMTDFESKQPLMKAHEAEREIDEKIDIELKKEIQKLNPAFESTEKQNNGHDDILQAVMDVASDKLSNDDVVIEIPGTKVNGNNKVYEEEEQQKPLQPNEQLFNEPPEEPRSDSEVPPPAPARKPRLGTMPPPNTLSEFQPTSEVVSPKQPSIQECDDAPRPPPRKPKRISSSAEDVENDASRYGNETAKQVCSEISGNGVHASAV